MQHIQTSQESDPYLSMLPLQLAESNNVPEATPVVHWYVRLWLRSVEILATVLKCKASELAGYYRMKKNKNA